MSNDSIMAKLQKAANSAAIDPKDRAVIAAEEGANFETAKKSTAPAKGEAPAKTEVPEATDPAATFMKDTTRGPCCGDLAPRAGTMSSKGNTITLPYTCGKCQAKWTATFQVIQVDTAEAAPNRKFEVTLKETVVTESKTTVEAPNVDAVIESIRNESYTWTHTEQKPVKTSVVTMTDPEGNQVSRTFTNGS